MTSTFQFELYLTTEKKEKIHLSLDEKWKPFSNLLHKNRKGPQGTSEKDWESDQRDLENFIFFFLTHVKPCGMENIPLISTI